LFDQIQAKAQAGVGRRVDMEQAGGRLALAESNLITETSNLHDVTARYQRIVGEIPPPQLAPADLTKTAIPAGNNEAASAALKQSPAIKATVAGVRAAQAEARGQQSAFMPRIDLRASENWQHNYLGTQGGYRDQVVEVALNYNLFKGGSDRARSRELAERLNQAKDLRDKACRDVRQTLAIAYNDTKRLAEQLRFLDQHQLAQEKVRDAYRKQFDIGQRTLLDLLDTENELFQARRAYANAENDLNVAYGRTHAAIGDLMPTLGLTRLEAEAEEDPNADPAASDVSAVCPPETPAPFAADREAILSEAVKATGSSPAKPQPQREQAPPGAKKPR
jgi:adhesin transport system outer membrane protein